MKLRTLTLGSAAVAGLMLLASPSFAQQSPYDTNPTPAEKAQTDQLNGQAANAAHDDSNANDAARQDYNAQRSDYDRARDAAEARRAAYERDRAGYDAHYGDAHRWDAFYGSSSFRDVMAMSSGELVGLQVNTRSGSRVGRIRAADTDASGRVTRVSVSVGNGQTAWVDAGDLRFDAGTRVVFTDLSRDQVEGMAHMRYPRF